MLTEVWEPQLLRVLISGGGAARMRFVGFVTLIGLCETQMQISRRHIRDEEFSEGNVVLVFMANTWKSKKKKEENKKP